MCVCMLILHARIFCMHVWADAMHGLAVSQQYPPSVSLRPPSKEAESLCVRQPLSLAPIVKLSKPVCSGGERTYREEHKSKDWEGEEKKWRIESGDFFFFSVTEGAGWGEMHYALRTTKVD